MEKGFGGMSGTPDMYHQTFRKLLREISGSLQETHNLDISDSFIIMMVKLVALDPGNRFILKQPAIRIEMERVKRVTIERIVGMTRIQRNIIRMQLHYKGNHFPRNELVQAHQVELEDQVKDILQDLKESVPQPYKQAELYYKKLIATIITKIDMGPASDSHVVKETEGALSSVFPQDEINLLSNMSPGEREREIRQFISMTAGIRLYNKELDPVSHGAGIDDVLMILPDKIYVCASLLSDMRERNIGRLIRYTTLVKPYFLENRTKSKGSGGDISHEYLWVRQGLVMVHQLLVYINELSVELTVEDEDCDNYTASYKKCLAELMETVRDNATVPTFIVYPKFIELSESWKRLQDSIVFLDTLIELVRALLEYSENDLKEVDPLAKRLSTSLKIPNEDHFFDFPAEQVSNESFVLATKIDFTPDMDPLSMMYSGFCVWSLVRGLGLVLLSNPNLGVFVWRNRHFLLASAEAAEDFRRDPDSYLYKAVFVARRWPELIFLLKLQHDVFNPETVADERPETVNGTRISQETGVQTEMHPIAGNIVPGYTWNEWEYRQRAILLSKLSKCATHSTQTHRQSLRTCQGTQTQEVKNSRQQTMRSVASEIPTSQFYLWGLRGCHQHPPHIMELSRDCTLCLKCFVPPKREAKKKTPCL